MKVTIQHDNRDCGAACLHMIARHYGYCQTMTFFREITGTDKTGVSLIGIIDGAYSLGFAAEALNGTWDDLISGVKIGEIPIPFIAHIIVDDSLQHFVVISDVNEKSLTVLDPSRGKYKVTKDEFSNMWTGCIVTLSKTDDFVGKRISQPTGLLRYFPIMKKHKMRVLGTVLLSVFVSLIGIAGAFVFQIVIDSAANGDIISLCTADNISFLSLIFPSLIAMYILAAGIQYARGRLIITMSKDLDMELSISFFNKIMDMPVGYLELRQTGDYLSRLSETTTIRDAISTTIMTLFLDAFMAIGCAVILCIQNEKLFCIASIVILIYALLLFAYYNKLTIANGKCMVSDAGIQSYFKESIDGFSTIKSNAAEIRSKKIFEKKYNEFSTYNVNRERLNISLESLLDCVQSVGIAAFLWCGFMSVNTGTLSLGSLMTFYALLGYFIEPVKNLMNLLPTINTASVAADRLSDILDASDENHFTNERSLNKVNEWSMENVDFRYGNDEFTLKSISIRVNAGEKIAIVGESGCGKTTIARLLMRFYEPDKGEIKADGVNLHNYGLSSVRRNVAYVEQDSFLFSGTIRDNLLLGNPKATEADVEEACKSAEILDYINSLPMGFETLIEENGLNLSGGQKQRLAIARALLKKPQLLIMDEATSNLDTITEAGVRKTIDNIGEDMSCIIIAHRLSTVKRCDRIYVIDKGEVVEKGSHDELYMKRGKYSQLIDSQQ